MKIWHLSNAASLKPDIVPVAELTRHQKGINVVRFSPCGKYIASGDDGKLGGDIKINTTLLFCVRKRLKIFGIMLFSCIYL